MDSVVNPLFTSLLPGVGHTGLLLAVFKDGSF
ncbi:hypothetical protein CoNPh35_CDS0044 [Staphylococcus phage S-CoN_Ph35]|nr:hypothetical protein CoNPh35_CDS0044 [Staphylococcus phage S-CoN_Ph35]